MIRTLFLGLSLAATLCFTAPAARADAALAAALDLARKADWPAAMATAPEGVARDIIEWQRLRAGEGTLGEYEAFLARRPDWPGLPLLKEKGEAAVARSETPDRVIAWFSLPPATEAPRTGEGAVALVRALLAQGRTTEAEANALRAWTGLSFTAADEEALLRLMPGPLEGAHAARLDALLWEGRRPEAERMLPRVGADLQALARARIALRAGDAGVDALVKAVPAALSNDPGLLHDRFAFRMRNDLRDGALELILAASDGDGRGLGRPEAWADRRASLARGLMRQGDVRTAWRLAAGHGLTSGSAFADLEFLAGFIALRHLDDPALALRHFARLKAEVSTPISLSRALYWKGRAEEAAGRKAEAEGHYRAAARHQTAYYGLLAAERLGLSLDPALLADDPAPGWRESGFAGSSVLAAGRMLQAAGDRVLAKRFFLHLAESLDDRELAQLAEMAFELDEPHVAVLVGKAAAERGVILPRAYFPVPDLVPDGLAVSRALALAIARRESEFDPAARSPADARGLMQVLPETAERMARRLDIPFDAARLTTDPAFNVTLGAAYLAEMVAEFGPSIALIASGYNAGPGRPRRWIDDFGDPRDTSVDIVDWVETIPFTETRTYVMRVVEGVVIYRARLKGEAGPIRISAELRG